MSYDFDLPCAGGTLASGAGVQPWSSPEQYVIFSIDSVGDLSYQSPEGFDGWLSAAGIGFKRLLGCYKGEQEPAWIINARDWRKLAASGWIDGQESVLHLGAWANGGRPATLYYGERIDGHIRFIEAGTFRLTTKRHALAQEGWTFDPSTTEYYVAE